MAADNPLYQTFFIHNHPHQNLAAMHTGAGRSCILYYWCVRQGVYPGVYQCVSGGLIQAVFTNTIHPFIFYLLFRFYLLIWLIQMH